MTRSAGLSVWPRNHQCHLDSHAGRPHLGGQLGAQLATSFGNAAGSNLPGGLADSE